MISGCEWVIFTPTHLYGKKSINESPVNAKIQFLILEDNYISNSKAITHIPAETFCKNRYDNNSNNDFSHTNLTKNIYQ